MSRPEDLPDHVVPLPGTQWSVWRDAVLRTSGFPAAGLDRLAAPETAAAADRALDGMDDAENTTFSLAYAEASRRCGKEISAIAADPLFREAVAWQNPDLVPFLAKLAADPEPVDSNRRRRQKRREREDMVTRYWQRYCGKNDTIGFFGPVTWCTLDPAAPAVRVRPGPTLTRKREAYLEYWALERFCEQLATDPDIRRWLPVSLEPHVILDDATVRHPDGPIALSATEASLIARCDGRPAIRAVDAPEQLAVLDKFAERGIVRWGVNMPYNPRAIGILRSTLEKIEDPVIAERALVGLRRLESARDAVAAAAGDPDRLSDALVELDAEFTAVTGSEPGHRAGQTYAGRRLCYEETVRDLDVTIGGPVLEALSGPMSVLLPAARWLSATMANTYRDALRDLFREIVGDDSELLLVRFWEPAQALLFGSGRPADRVAADFAARWEKLFGLDAIEPGIRHLELRSADLLKQLAEMFPARRPGWAGARIHSPDLQISATSVEALVRGDFSIVLGEMHAAWPTLDCGVFIDRHPDPERMYAAAAADIGAQIRPLYPTDWPRYTARIAPMLGRTDEQFAFAAAPGGDPARLLPISAYTLMERDNQVLAVAPDGSSRQLTDFFALLMGWLATDAFRLQAAGSYSPRITLDRLVVGRQTWRTSVGETGLRTVVGQEKRYLAARAFRRRMGLPERVFVRVATEIKPFYLDFTSPRYVSSFCGMIRNAGGDEVAVTFSEMLPEPDQAWVPDAAGNGYFSELRVQFRDPMAPGADHEDGDSQQ
jgi:hypothetical protein